MKGFGNNPLSGVHCGRPKITNRQYGRQNTKYQIPNTNRQYERQNTKYQYWRQNAKTMKQRTLTMMNLCWIIIGEKYDDDHHGYYHRWRWWTYASPTLGLREFSGSLNFAPLCNYHFNKDPDLLMLMILICWCWYWSADALDNFENKNERRPAKNSTAKSEKAKEETKEDENGEEEPGENPHNPASINHSHSER